MHLHSTRVADRVLAIIESTVVRAESLRGDQRATPPCTPPRRRAPQLTRAQSAERLSQSSEGGGGVVFFLVEIFLERWRSRVEKMPGGKMVRFSWKYKVRLTTDPNSVGSSPPPPHTPLTFSTGHFSVRRRHLQLQGQPLHPPPEPPQPKQPVAASATYPSSLRSSRPQAPLDVQVFLYR